MAARIKTRPSDLYQQDLYAWSKAQADLLRAGRFAELDLQHVVEEIEDVGGALRRSVRNRIRNILEHLLKLEHSPATEHLLKLEHSPATEPRAGWCATARTQRVRLRDALTPLLYREVANDLGELYRDARALAEGALRDHGEHAAADALPESCPYPLDQITSDWLPN
jgi:Domain of unknown function DUF29